MKKRSIRPKKASEVKSPEKGRLGRAGNARTKLKAAAGGEEKNVVGEEMIAYGPNASVVSAHESQVNEFSAFQKMKMSETGISKKELEKLKERVGLNYEQLAKMLLVTKATLINKPGSFKFNSGVSEKIISIWEIYAYGFTVFGDESLFREWLFRKNRALSGKMPFEFLHSSFGREEIKNLIGRIEYGVYS